MHTEGEGSVRLTPFVLTSSDHLLLVLKVYIFLLTKQAILTFLQLFSDLLRLRPWLHGIELRQLPALLELSKHGRKHSLHRTQPMPMLWKSYRPRLQQYLSTLMFYLNNVFQWGSLFLQTLIGYRGRRRKGNTSFYRL